MKLRFISCYYIYIHPFLFLNELHLQGLITRLGCLWRDLSRGPKTLRTMHCCLVLKARPRISYPESTGFLVSGWSPVETTRWPKSQWNLGTRLANRWLSGRVNITGQFQSCVKLCEVVWTVYVVFPGWKAYRFLLLFQKVSSNATVSRIFGLWRCFFG